MGVFCANAVALRIRADVERRRERRLDIPRWILSWVRLWILMIRNCGPDRRGDWSRMLRLVCHFVGGAKVEASGGTSVASPRSSQRWSEKGTLPLSQTKSWKRWGLNA